MLAPVGADTDDSSDAFGLPPGLTEESRATYSKEWRKYYNFAFQRLGYVPGEHEPWDVGILWQYMRSRAETCKPTTLASHLSKLAHAGVTHGHLLPLQKSEQPTLLYKQVKRITRQLQLEYSKKEAAGSGGGSIPVGNAVVTAMLQTFKAYFRGDFLALSRANRHHLLMCALQHTAALRFGHFLHKKFKVRDITWLADGTAQLLTDWQRYPGKPPATLRFPSVPHWACQMYHPKDRINTWDVTASMLLQWHVSDMCPDDYIFEPVPAMTPTRESRQRWMRKAMSLTYESHYVPTGSATDQDALTRALARVTPHSFRGGLAVDLRNEKASWEQISVEGRWRSKRAVKIYASRSTLDAQTGLQPCARIPKYKLQLLEAAALAPSRRGVTDRVRKRARVDP